MSLVFNYHKDLPKVSELKQQYLREQVKYLKSIFQPEQKSPEWYEMRNTMLTASDWGTILGENHYSNSNEVLLKKCGEDKFITNSAMQWGNKYEDVAVLIYKYRNNVDVLEFGCLRHPFLPFLGASPDGITPDGIMLEIKCPVSRKITGIPPSYYWCQVQGQLEVCELDRCDFLECSLKEYTEDEFLADNYEGNYRLNKYGNEKGVVVEYFIKETKSFFFEYSPVCMSAEEYKEWINYCENKYDSSKGIMISSYSYWYLLEASCVPIYRNQEWFNDAKVKLELFWNDVLKYRELGLAQLKADLGKKKEEKNIAKLQVKEEKEKIKREEREEKDRLKEEKNKSKVKKEDSSKKQKKIKDFISLDDIVEKETLTDDSDEVTITQEKVSITTTTFSFF